MLPETFVALICTLEKSCCCPQAASGAIAAAPRSIQVVRRNLRMYVLLTPYFFITSSRGILPLEVARAYDSHTVQLRGGSGAFEWCTEGSACKRCAEPHLGERR